MERNTTPQCSSGHTKSEIEPSFPGGEEAWNRYITNVIKQNIKEISDEGIAGTCQIRFIVNRDGRVMDVTALTLRGTKLAKVAVNAILKGPKWSPGQQNGHYVASYRIQPVTFAIQTNKSKKN